MQHDTLHKGASGRQFEYARAMRRSGTDAEALLWQNLRNRNMSGFKFRRQHPVDKYIADFYCHEAKLIIEVDGKVHEDYEQKEYDAGRTYELEQLGITVLRFKNSEVENSIEEVLDQIRKYLSER